MDYSGQTIPQLLEAYCAIVEELKGRGVIRTGNLVGDYAEYLVAQALHLSLADNSTSGVDAYGTDGTRYQVKARRRGSGLGWRELGVIRRLEERNFDYLVAVFFDEQLRAVDVYRIPYHVVARHARYDEHVNGHKLICDRHLLDDPEIERIDELSINRRTRHRGITKGIGRDGESAPRTVGGERRYSGAPSIDLDASGHIPVGSEFTSKSELAHALARWLDCSEAATVGDTARFGGKPWLRIHLSKVSVALTADTTRAAVQCFIEDAGRRGEDAPWPVVANQRGNVNKVVFNENGGRVPGWYCYLLPLGSTFEESRTV